MNTNLKILLFSVITLAIGLLLGWIFFDTSSTSKKASGAHDHEQGTETVYTCSMHPQIRQDEPGACPICGMDLVPVSQAEAQSDPLAVTMSETAMKLANVQTEKVRKAAPEKILQLNGIIQASEERTYTQAAHISGRIEQLSITYIGQHIKGGEVLGYIYSPDLVTSQEELLEAYKKREQIPSLFEAAKRKLLNLKISESQISRIVRTGEIRQNFPVLANHSGFVSKKLVNEGAYTSRGQPLFEISDLREVWALIDLYESDLPWIETGDSVTLRTISDSGINPKGKISFIDPYIDPSTRVAKARVVVDNSNLQLKPGMFITAEVSGSTNDDQALVIPASAVLWTGKRSVVYLKEKSAAGIAFSFKEIKLGPSLGDSYVVREGLSEGDEIATQGTFSIDAAAQLAGQRSMMSSDGVKKSSEQTIIFDYPEDSLRLSNEEKRAFTGLYEKYLRLKNRLVDDDFEDALSATKDFKDEISNLNSSVLQETAKGHWRKYKSVMDEIIQPSSSYTNIGMLRADFKRLSEAVIHMTGTLDPYKETLYVQHCPMADDFEGADWLSTSEKILNPYFGESMLTCGEVIDSIK